MHDAQGANQACTELTVAFYFPLEDSGHVRGTEGTPRLRQSTSIRQVSARLVYRVGDAAQQVLDSLLNIRFATVAPDFTG